ncbi:PAC2 family protein [Leucobacter sp. HNU]|uniref:PAC2 family protein n=1 Tax=Leucobacter sp. HNU TaxID=3236805 RepID=UPI003A80DFC5
MTRQPHPDPARVLIAAFEGWSDAGSATTTALQHIGELIGAEVLHTIGADGFVDFQVHRPRVRFDEQGHRVLEWPETRLYGTVQRPGEPKDPAAETVRRIDGTPVTDLFLLAGVEPARDWTAFADEVVDVIEAWGIDTVILLGAMFSDAPHSRPIAVSLSSDDPEQRARTGAQRSDYEGPVGIASILAFSLAEANISSVSLWAQVPHYVHSVPSPKATLAILDKLEELLDVVIPRGELLTESNDWEASINRIAADDEDMASYIRRLEEARDASASPEATGDALAYEFEKFLRDDEPDADGGTPPTA